MPEPTTPPRAHRRPWWRSDTGAVSVQILYVAVIGLLFAAALYGGGTLMAARSHGYSLAQSAARAGAQQIDLEGYRATGQIRLDPTRAARAATRYLTAAGATGTVDSIDRTQITVTATSHQPTPALRLFGFGAVTVTSTASATVVLTAGG